MGGCRVRGRGMGGRSRGRGEGGFEMRGRKKEGFGW